MSGVCYSDHILMNLEFSRQIFEKNTQIRNFTKIPSVEARLFHAEGRTDRQADRHEEANSLFS